MEASSVPRGLTMIWRSGLPGAFGPSKVSVNSPRQL
jgi:hypothetical protein